MPRRSLRFGVDTGLFFVLFYLYVWRVIDPRLVHHSWLVIDVRLIYHYMGILRPYFPFSFSTGWPFFWEHLTRPGGLVDYGVRFVSQFYGWGWAGALAITAVALYACLCTDVLTRLGGGSRGMVLRYVPAVLLLVMYGGYHHSLSMILSLLAGLSGFLLYVRWAPQGTVRRLVVLAVTCVALYHAAGAGSLSFLMLAAIFELSVGRRILGATMALACVSLLFWIVGTRAVDVDFDQVRGSFQVFGLNFWRGYLCALALSVFFPAVLAGAAVWRGVRRRRASRAADGAPAGADASSTGRALRSLRRGASHWAVRMVVAFAASGVIAWCSLDRNARVVLEIDYYAQHENWTAVLDAADGTSENVFNGRCIRNILLALYHTGQLGDEMFRYPQRSLADLFSGPASVWEVGCYYQVSRLFLELGQVNLAEKYASEALEILGDLPAILKHLAVIHLVKGRPETAKVFLNALAKNPAHGKTAGEMLRRLEEDPRQESDPRIRRIRRAMVTTDRLAADMTAEDVLQALLEKDPHNKMAFEFLMAYYLCDRRTDRVVAGVDRLKDLSYRRIPRHYQEAIIVLWGVPTGSPPIAGYRLDPETIRSGEDAWKTMGVAPTREEGRRRGMAAGFGDTYFFYYLYGESGL